MSESESKLWRERFLRRRGIGAKPTPGDERQWSEEYMKLPKDDQIAVTNIMAAVQSGDGQQTAPDPAIKPPPAESETLTVIEPEPAPEREKELPVPASTRTIQELCDRLADGLLELDPKLPIGYDVGSFALLYRIVLGWNQSVAHIPPQIGEQTALVQSLIEQQAKVIEKLESLETIMTAQREAAEKSVQQNERIVNGLMAIYRLLDKGGKK